MLEAPAAGGLDDAAVIFVRDSQSLGLTAPGRFCCKSSKNALRLILRQKPKQAAIAD
jgi:hypothetical protein